MFQKIVRLLFIGIISISILSCDEGSSDPVNEGPQNLLLNSNFEGDTDGEPTYWTAYNVADYELTWSTEEAFSGTHSLRISNEVSNTDDFVYWFQTQCMYVPVNQALTVKAMIKLEGVTGDGIFIAVRGDDRNGVNYYFDSTQGDVEITGTHDWQEYSIPIENFTNLVQCVSILLIYGTNTTGTVYFDDVKMEY